MEIMALIPQYVTARLKILTVEMTQVLRNLSLVDRTWAPMVSVLIMKRKSKLIFKEMAWNSSYAQLFFPSQAHGYAVMS